MATPEIVITDKRHGAMPETQYVPPSMMAMIATAVQRGDTAQLERLMDLQDRYDKTEARKAFVEAMTAFKAHDIHVVKDKDNGQYKSKYVSLGKLVATVTPFLSQHGLSVRWDIDQTNGIKVTCIVTHVQGHSESVPMIVPPDKSGSKNPIQEIKSAITYAKACTFESICGLASTDANLDDDGNACGGGTPAWVGEFTDAMDGAADYDELDRYFREAFKKANGDTKIQKILVAAKDCRRGELRNANHQL